MVNSKERLKLSGLFKQVYSNGLRLKSKHLNIVYTPSLNKFENDLPLVGFSVSKKFCKRAVGRNKIKRRMQNAFETFKHQLNAEKLKAYKNIFGLIVISPNTKPLAQLIDRTLEEKYPKIVKRRKIPPLSSSEIKQLCIKTYTYTKLETEMNELLDDVIQRLLQN